MGWREEWAQELTAEQRANLRSWGQDVPEPTPAPPPERPHMPKLDPPKETYCTDNAHTAACTGSELSRGMCNRRSPQTWASMSVNPEYEEWLRSKKLSATQTQILRELEGHTDLF